MFGKSKTGSDIITIQFGGDAIKEVICTVYTLLIGISIAKMIRSSAQGGGYALPVDRIVDDVGVAVGGSDHHRLRGGGKGVSHKVSVCTKVS